MANKGAASGKAVAAFVGGFVGLLLLMGGCTAACIAMAPDSQKPTARAPEDAIPRISRVLITPAPGEIVTLPCRSTPTKLVEIIDAAFTNGEHLAHTQSVDGPSGSQIVGGGIVAADGTTESNRDTWVMRGGAMYALTSGARRHTTLPDGRGDWAWESYSDSVGACVDRVERAANQSR
ncbi:hypothetical protein R2362_23970 [Mycobacteroides chelonae]|jgi:hypothetical protein|nr:hypothetical protein [Mycobacteroides chelonae]